MSSDTAVAREKNQVGVTSVAQRLSEVLSPREGQQGAFLGTCPGWRFVIFFIFCLLGGGGRGESLATGRRLIQ